MQRTELIRKLRKGGFKIIGDNPHSKAYNPSNPKIKIPIPNGSKINDITAKKILKDAGLT